MKQDSFNGERRNSLEEASSVYLLNRYGLSLKMLHLTIPLHLAAAAPLIILSILRFQLNAAPLPQVSTVTAKPRAPRDELETVWYRISKNCYPRQKQMARVQVLFGGRNRSGKDMASSELEWEKWTDDNNAFLVSPAFKDGN